jgi:hypothetical protein
LCGVGYVERARFPDRASRKTFSLQSITYRFPSFLGTLGMGTKDPQFS